MFDEEYVTPKLKKKKKYSRKIKEVMYLDLN